MKREPRARRYAVRGMYFSAMLNHDALANRQAKSGGITISTKAGLEDKTNLIGPNAAAVIAEFRDHTGVNV